jgi:5-methylcytosine-specific restriction endonuclease McrBC GTP-binding regulatory subunit McrB
MENTSIIERIISKERLQPYSTHHKNNQGEAIQHYKSNILVSEAFYPLLSILEIGVIIN